VTYARVTGAVIGLLVLGIIWLFLQMVDIMRENTKGVNELQERVTRVEVILEVESQ
jgi:hypothetical protein